LSMVNLPDTAEPVAADADEPITVKNAVPAKMILTLIFDISILLKHILHTYS